MRPEILENVAQAIVELAQPSSVAASLLVLRLPFSDARWDLMMPSLAHSCRLGNESLRAKLLILR